MMKLAALTKRLFINAVNRILMKRLAYHSTTNPETVKACCLSEIICFRK